MNLGDVTNKTVPKMSLLAPARNGGLLSTRTFIPHRVHESIGVLGAVSVATACMLQGSVAAQIAGLDGGSVRRPRGPMSNTPPDSSPCRWRSTTPAGQPVVTKSALLRTARTLDVGLRPRTPIGLGEQMIIDCHGHYTTAPELHNQWRIDQLAAFKAGEPTPAYPEISDDVIRASIEENQLKLITERGTDLTIFSPRASAMGHHEGDQRISLEWTVACNNLIKRVVDLFPETFVGVCQLPQSPGADLTESHQGTRALRHRARLHRLQPEPRPERRQVGDGSADGQVLVPALREDGRARRSGHDPRVGVVQLRTSTPPVRTT